MRFVVVLLFGFGAFGVRADCLPFEAIVKAGFDGLALPTNAELRVIGPPSEFLLSSSSGDDTLFLDVAFDERGQVVVLPDELRPLPVGTYSFTFNQIEGAFTVVDEVDTTPPDAPVATVRFDSKFVLAGLLPFDDCGEAGFDTSATFTVDGTSAGDAIVVGQRVVAVGEEGSTTFTIGVGSDTSGPFDVRLRDLAGNESAATSTASDRGCAASGDAGAVVTLACLLRRRATRRIVDMFIG